MASNRRFIRVVGMSVEASTVSPPSTLPLPKPMFKSRTGGVVAAWKEIEDAALPAADLLWNARGPVAASDNEAGFWLRGRVKQARTDGGASITFLGKTA